MDCEDGAAHSVRSDAVVVASQWDKENKENAVMAFEPDDKPHRLRAWQREQRPATKQNGKNRIIWKRHETRARTSSASNQAISSAPRSPQKVVKKVCLSKESVANTPKNKRLGIAARWDRRQSDRLHKPRSVRITSPLKVRRDSVGRDGDHKVQPLLEGNQPQEDDTCKFNVEGSVTAKVDVVAPLDGNVTSLEQCADVFDTSSEEYETLNQEDDLPIHDFCVEETILSSLQADNEQQPDTISVLLSSDPALASPTPEDSLEDDVVQSPREQSYEENNSDTELPSGAKHPEETVQAEHDKEHEAIADVDLKCDKIHTDLGATDASADYVAESHRESLDSPEQDIHDTAFTENCSVQHIAPVAAADDHHYTKSQEYEMSSDDSAEQEDIDDNNDDDDDDETCIEFQQEIGDIDDERMEIAIGSPGRTGPVDTPDIFIESKQEESNPDQGLIDKHVTAILADDDMFANLDDAIAKENIRNSLNVPVNHLDTTNGGQQPEERVELVEETTTITVQLNDNDDTEMLRDFLNRSRANKAARIAKRSSLNNKRDSDAVKLALSSPQKSAVEEIDQTTECAMDLPKLTNDFVSLSPEPSTTMKAADPDLPDDLAGSPAPKSSRRSARNRDLKSTPSTITIRRPDGSEPFLLKKSEAQELAVTTRANTRRNKGGALSAKLMLMRLKSLDPESLPDVEREPVIKWDEELVKYFDERNVDGRAQEAPSEANETLETTIKPRVRRKRTLGAMNGTPARPKQAEDTLASIEDSATVARIPQVELRVVDSQSQAPEELQVEGDPNLHAVKKKRAIPKPTSRVPKRTGLQYDQSHQNVRETQQLQTRDSPKPGVSAKANDNNDEKTVENTIPQSRSRSGSSNGWMHPIRSSGTAPRTQLLPDLGSQINSPSATEVPAAAAAAGRAKVGAKTGTATSAIASAAASVSKRGINVGILDPRGSARETRSAVKR